METSWRLLRVFDASSALRMWPSRTDRCLTGGKAIRIAPTWNNLDKLGPSRNQINKAWLIGGLVVSDQQSFLSVHGWESPVALAIMFGEMGVCCTNRPCHPLEEDEIMVK